MRVTFHETHDQKAFEELLLNIDYPFTQGFAYGEWHRRTGRTVRRFVIQEGDRLVAIFQIIKFPLPLGKSRLYIPHGPVLKQPMPDGLAEALAQKFAELAQHENAIFVRFDPFPSDPIVSVPGAQSVSARLAAFQQPSHEWLLPLDKSEDELLLAMHPKHRYNIRLAERKGVTVEIVEQGLSQHFETFYHLLQETARRDGFRLHPEAYYRSALDAGEEHRNSWLVLGRYRESVLAAHLIIRFGKTASYVFGGSASEQRNLMAPHLAHWRAIQNARTQGYSSYNFGGISDRDLNWRGLSLFKKRFGGRPHAYALPQDLVSQPLWYRFYQWRPRPG